jgi:hypothetical protein
MLHLTGPIAAGAEVPSLDDDPGIRLCAKYSEGLLAVLRSGKSSCDTAGQRSQTQQWRHTRAHKGVAGSAGGRRRAPDSTAGAGHGLAQTDWRPGLSRGRQSHEGALRRVACQAPRESGHRRPQDLIITSANLTGHGMRRNLEFGLRVLGRPAGDAADHLDGLIRAGVFKLVPWA